MKALLLLAGWWTGAGGWLVHQPRLATAKTCGLNNKPSMCPKGQCCSEANYCGTGSDYCSGSQCQLEYSDSCDTFFGPGGPDTDEVPRSKIGPVPYGTTITKCVEPGTMALTFDDGPWHYTNQMLDLLAELGVTATFFVAGNNKGKGHIDDPATGWPEILRRMDREGHQIGSHTWTHRNLDQLQGLKTQDNPDLGYDVRRTEIMFNEMALRNVFGWFPAYFRPPYLECGSECLGFLGDWGYHVVSTNVDTKDYMFDEPTLIARARRRFSDSVSEDASENSYIVLAHDVHFQTVTNLTEYMVRTARERGYRLVTLGECLGDPRKNWYRPARELQRRSCPSHYGEGHKSEEGAEKPGYEKPTHSQHGPEDHSKLESSHHQPERPPKPKDTDRPPEHPLPKGTHQSLGHSQPKDTHQSPENPHPPQYHHPPQVPSQQPPQHPHPLSHPGPNAPGQRCGINGHTCHGAPRGPCCSHYGYCGSTPEYCGTGCNAAFGSCDPVPPGISASTNGLCGPKFAAFCPHDGPQPCCSRFGFCGSGDDYCGSGCQHKYGMCS